MCKKTTLFLALFMLSLTSILWSNYMIGGFVYNKPTWSVDLTSQVMQKMHDAHYDTAVSSAVYNTAPADFTNLLNTMYNNYGIVGIPDYYTFIPAQNRYGARTLSIGNYFRFEAEYANNLALSQADQRFPDTYFYMSSNADSARIGVHNSDEDNAFSNGYYWRVNNGQQGYAYKDLTYKWPNGINTTQRNRVGYEFRFPQNGTGNEAFFNQNELYITFSMQCIFDTNLPDTTRLAAIRFNCKGPYTNSSMYVDIRHFPDPAVQDSCLFSYITKASYLSSPPNLEYPGQRLVTVSIPIKSLNWYGAINKSIWFWDEALINLNPNLWWYGQGTLKLDYIEFKDKLFRDYTSNDNILAQMQTFNQPYVYGYDEPAQGQFESFRRITRYWETTPAQPQLVTAVHQSNKQAIKTNGVNYKHRQAFWDAVTPKTIFIDEYPFNRFYSPDWTNPSSNVFVQKYIDNVCNQYDSCRVMCGTDKKFVAVPQTYGEWYNSTNIWKYLFPPDKVQKSLQLLPLCYKADGIIDFMIYNNTTVNSKGSREYGIVNIEPGHDTLSVTPQYLAIKEANLKIKIYAPIVERLYWHGAGTIMTYSPEMSLDNVLLDSLLIPTISNPTLYQGYVQVGLYTDSNTNNPYFMLVNRRANIAPSNLSSIGPGDDNLDAYNLACSQVEPQTVQLYPNAVARTIIASYPALKDPFDGSLYKFTNQAIEVPIGPGDGKLLQMVGTLPVTVSSDAHISYDGYITNNVSITNQADVVFSASSNVTVSPNVTINVGENCSLSIYGRCSLAENSHIVVNPGGILNINLANSNQVCTFANNSGIEVIYGVVNISNGTFTFAGNSKVINNGGLLNISNSSFVMGSGYIKVFSTSYPEYEGSLHISNSYFNKSPSNNSWGGFWADDALEVHLENTTVSNAQTGILAENTNIYLHNTIFEIPTIEYDGNFTQCFGLNVTNDTPGKVVQITADDSTCGFIGLDGVTDPLELKTGMFV